jgi:hypothetical protein
LAGVVEQGLESGGVFDGAGLGVVPRARREAEDGSGSAAGDVLFSRGFAETGGLAEEGLDGGGGALRGLVGGDAAGGFIGRVEEGADGGLGDPGDELGELELVVVGDVDERVVAVDEVGQEPVVVHLDAVDVVVDGGLERGMECGGDHGGNVPRG